MNANDNDRNINNEDNDIDDDDNDHGDKQRKLPVNHIFLETPA